MKELKVYPSILAADFGKLRQEIKDVETAGADGIHIDTMDGHFVPNLSFGAPILKSIKDDISTEADCHLMVTNPDELLEDFAKAGADRITVHWEACTHLQRTVSRIKELGCKAGVSINPATRFEELEYVLDDIDLILSMTVNPGFGGQKLIPAAMAKTQQLIRWLEEKGKRESILIQIDGGVNQETVGQAKEIGVDIVVAGNAVFSKSDYKAAITGLK